MEEKSLDFLNNISLGQMGAGFLLGLSVGFFFKKSFKIMLFFLGLGVVVLFLLDSNNIVTVNSDTILGTFDKIALMLKHFATFLQHKLSNLELEGGAGAIAGFLVGIKAG